MKKYLMLVVIILQAFIIDECLAVSPNNTPLTLDISSAKNLSGIAGDYVTVTGQVKNTSQASIKNITTYLSLADTINKLPVDLEDWSAEKGLFIGTIDPGQAFPLAWKIHFVK